MKICMLTSGHGIYDNRIYYKEILSLKKRYNEIYIVAPGEKDFVTEDGIKVRCFKKKKAWYDRIRPMRDLYRIGKEINADVYHAHEPDSYQVAINLKKHTGAKIIYDSHEYYPEAFSEHFNILRNLVKNILYIYEKRASKKADYVISVNDILINKFKRYNKNVALIPNYPVISQNPIEKQFNEIPTFIYVGGLREDRGISQILQAIKHVEGKYRYILIGEFESKEYKEEVNKFVKENLKDQEIIFTGLIPHTEVFDYLKEAWAGFVILQPQNWRYVNAEPVKLFEYMIGKVVVLGSDYPMIRNVVDKFKCGFLVNPTDERDIAKSIDKIAKDYDKVKDMCYRGFKGVEKEYNWNICEKELFNVYKKLEEIM